MMLAGCSASAQTNLSTLSAGDSMLYKNVFISGISGDSLHFNSDSNNCSVKLEEIKSFRLYVKDTRFKVGIVKGLAGGLVLALLIAALPEDSEKVFDDFGNRLKTGLIIGLPVGLLVGMIGEIVQASEKKIKEADTTFNLSVLTNEDKKKMLIEIQQTQNELLK